MGELTIGHITQPAPKKPDKIDQGTTDSRGVERMSSSAIDTRLWAISQFAVVASTDASPPRIGELYQYAKDSESSLGPAYALVIGGLMTSIALGSTVEKNVPQKLSSRRGFLKNMAFLGGSAATGVLTGNLLSDAYFRKETHLDLSGLSEFDQDRAAIYGNYSQFLDKNRDRKMTLDSVALSVLDLSEELTDVRLAFAGGHLDMLKKFNKDQGFEQQLEAEIMDIAQKHANLTLKYMNDPDKDKKQGLTALSLASYFGSLDPIVLRVNKNQTSLDLNQVRSKQKDQAEGKSTHFVLMETLSKVEAKMKNGDYSKNDSQKQALLQVFQLATVVNQKRLAEFNDLHVGDDFEFSLAGDKSKVDQVIKAFGTQTSFSKGLTASTEVIK